MIEFFSSATNFFAAVIQVFFEKSGKECDEIPFEHILTELDYARKFGEPDKPPTAIGPINFRRLNPRELFEARCGQCTMCCEKDCGKCKTCVENSRSTTTFRQVCLRKVRL